MHKHTVCRVKNDDEINNCDSRARKLIYKNKGFEYSLKRFSKILYDQTKWFLNTTVHKSSEPNNSLEFLCLSAVVE